MLATDANGLPLGMLTMSAGVGEVRNAEATLATISVPQKKGKPRSRPQQLIADKGYDSRKLRLSLHLRGIRPCTRPSADQRSGSRGQGVPLRSKRRNTATVGRWSRVPSGQIRLARTSATATH
jgi:hypothetical protein